MNESRKKAKAVIVGGSIAGVSCAHALIVAGWDVVVLEKSSAPSKGSPTGAGLGLDCQSQTIIDFWLQQPKFLEQVTLPLTIDQNQVTDREKKVPSLLTRDENFNFRAAHWADLHDILFNALPREVVLWGHVYQSFSISQNDKTVTVKAKVLEIDKISEIKGELLVAADGCFSSIRQTFLPDLKLRYSGYCAWRGVLDFSKNETSETLLGIRRLYPDLGKCLYFELSHKTHCVLYELLNKRLNWIWYARQSEPQLKGNSVTMKVSSDMIENMYQEAEKIWVPELVRVMRETKDPFLNFIYDCDPLEQIVWDNVVLIGDAAHPTSPHGLRSTNMSILDAAVLGKCLEKWGPNNLPSALEEYQRTRLPVTSKQVLHSRRVGRIKQGLSLPDRVTFDPQEASTKECEELQQKLVPFFGGAPLTIG
ncbi:hypothetical protein K2173_025881 [Erythroxylum novogranatense]|uniref:FAD-binding domain-containing protein n=1 Tax=Erythroxylum novogranatense TaxID=1862640 RepID=A0AAV8SID7_9ROSI|nr:hypothetical protein K2173_025881 [Erythroxylum novogranatense]